MTIDETDPTVMPCAATPAAKYVAVRVSNPYEITFPFFDCGMWTSTPKRSSDASEAGAPRRARRGADHVGVFSVAMFAMAAFVVDLGNQRQNRLQLSTATDSAALDVAQEWANAELDGSVAGFAGAGAGRWDCTSVARNIVRANNDGADADTVDCVAELERDDWGVVTVAVGEVVDHQFGSAVGTDSGMSRSTTSVKVSGAAQGGLRPFAVCSGLPAIE